MKKLLIGVALLAACGTTATVAAPAPVVEKRVEENPYTGVVTALRAFIDLGYYEFEAVCADLGGNFNFSGEVATCLDESASGFALRFEPGRTLGAAVVVPISHGKKLAEAAIEEAGPPDYSEGNTATWEFVGFVMVFTPTATGQHYLLVLEHTDEAL